jgi:putative transcriptional regulator
MDLENNIKLMRFKKNQITQEELANKVSVSRQTIIAIEQGRFNPSVKLALGMAAFFECNVEEIFYLKKKKEKTK